MNYFLLLVELSLFPFVFISALLMKLIRRIGLEKLPISKFVLSNTGVMPIRNHYYEPKFVYSSSEVDLLDRRNLNGIDLNVEFQLDFINSINSLCLGNELIEESFGSKKKNIGELNFEFQNGSFESGDAEIYYNIIRKIKPKKIIEIGSGNSTLVALEAVNKNYEEGVSCDVFCIEPYEMTWLEKTNAQVIREKVEDIDINIFLTLQENDILFIDSSHIIRPSGDVLFNFLTILPSLNKGVYVHIHDIFTPKNYPAIWISDKCLLWNEQYLLEAFLTNNESFHIVCAVNYLLHNHFNMLKSVAPFIDSEREPGSFWIQKIK